jgi:hypothetical protein
MTRELMEREALVVRRNDEQEVDDAFEAVTYAPALARALGASERRALHTEALGPIRRAIEEDPAATSAVRKLSQRLKSDIDALKPHDRLRSSGTSWSFDVPSGTSVFTLPYDYARPGPTHGSTVEVNPDPIAGAISIWVDGDYEYDGALTGTAAGGFGVGVPEPRLGFCPAVRRVPVQPLCVRAYAVSDDRRAARLSRYR